MKRKRNGALTALAAIHSFAGLIFVASSLYVVFDLYLGTIVKDQWRIYHDFFSMPFLAAIGTLQNKHPFIFPSILYQLDLFVFGAQNTFLIATALFLNAATATLFTIVLFRDRELSRNWQIQLTAFVWMSFFWLANHFALNWGALGVVSHLILTTVAGSTLAIFRMSQALSAAANRRAALWFSVALLSAGIASFTASQGMVVWPTLIIAALLARLPRSSFVILGCGFGFCVWAVLFGLPRTAEFADGFSYDPIAIMQIAAGWLGSILHHAAKPTGSQFIDTTLSPLLGWLAILLLSAITLYKLWRRRAVSELEGFLLSLAMFGLGVALLPGIARYARYGADLTPYYSARYSTWVVLFWVALLPLLVLLASRLSKFRQPVALAMAALLCSLPLLLWDSHLSGATAAAARRNRARQAALGLVVGVHDLQAVKKHLFKSPTKVDLVAAELRDRNLGMFRDGRHLLIDRAYSASFGDIIDGRCSIRVTDVERFTDGDGVSARLRAALGGVTRNDPEPLLVVVDDRDVVRGLGVFPVASRWRLIAGEGATSTRAFAYVRSFRGLEAYRFVYVDGEAAYACARTPPPGDG